MRDPIRTAIAGEKQDWAACVLAMRGGGSLEPEERSALVLRAAQHQAERLHDTMIESSGVLRRRVSRRGWIPAMQADEVGEVVELARAHLECGELGDADRVLPTPGFRALLHAEELSVTLETTDAIARSLDLEVIEVSLSDLLDAEGEKMNADGAGFSVEAFLGGARQQYLVLVNLGEQTGPQPDESLTGRLSKIAHVTDGLLVAVMETRHPPSRQWARYFQRQIRLSSKDPGGCGYIRQLAADAGWKWEVTETALSPERFRRSRDVLRDVFREATFRAVLSGHAGVMTRESLEGGLERVGRRDALAGAVLFGRR